MVSPKHKASEGPSGEANADKGQSKGAVNAKTTETPTPAAPKPAVRRGPSAKEVIPFKWKLVGDAQGMILTLFKAVEREEVEAQFERIRREGYYADLRILDADEKIKQSAATKSVLMRAREGKPKTPKKMAKVRGKPARALKAEKAAPPSQAAKTVARALTSKPTKPTKTAKAAETTKAAKTAKTAKAAKPKAPAKTKKKKATSTKTRKKRTAKPK